MEHAIGTPLRELVGGLGMRAGLDLGSDNQLQFAIGYQHGFVVAPVPEVFTSAAGV
jgi:hypothetical protein